MADYVSVYKKLEKYDVNLDAWAHVKLAIRFYTRSVIALWVLASLLSVAAAIFLAVRFAHLVVMGSVPSAVLGYFAAVIAASFVPIAVCLYMLDNIRFAFDRFIESVKLARITAREGYEVDAGEVLSYYWHSVADHDKHGVLTERLAVLIAVIIAIAAMCSLVGFVQKLYLSLEHDGLSAAAGFVDGIVVGSESMLHMAGQPSIQSFLLGANIAIAVLTISVGALFLVSKKLKGNSNFLRSNEVMECLKHSYWEYGYSADIKVRGEDAGAAGAILPYPSNFYCFAYPAVIDSAQYSFYYPHSFVYPQSGYAEEFPSSYMYETHAAENVAANAIGVPQENNTPIRI